MSKRNIYWGSYTPYEPEVIDYFNHADVAVPNDGTVYNIGTPQQITGAQLWDITQELIAGWKADLGLVRGIRNLASRLPILYLRLGWDVLQHRLNFSDTTKFIASYFGGWIHGFTGATPNGSNAYMTSTTGLFAGISTIPGLNGYVMESVSVGFDSKTNDDGLMLDIYSQDGARPDIICYGKLGGNNLSRLDGNGVNNSAPIADSLGLYIMNRVNSNLYEVHKENVLINSVAKTCGQEIGSGLLYEAGINGNQSSTRKRTLSFLACKPIGIIGGFSPTERTNFTNRWRTFETQLNR